MNIWRPFCQMQTAPAPLPVARAKDALLFLEDGREIIDAISSWWVITHGHCRDEIVSAIGEQARQIDQILFANFSHKTGHALAENLSNFLPKSLSHMFFSDNGSTAVEVALKMALQYWQQAGQPQRKTFLSFERAYHGDTAGAMSVSGRGIFTAPYESMLFEVRSLKQGRFSTDPAEEFTSDFKQAVAKDADTIAAVIIEPLVQGAGGMVIWPADALEEIHRICREKGILLIFDEVMTGFGRTGSLFAFQQLSFTPDIACFSKGLTAGALPLSLTVAGEDIYRAFLSKDKAKMFFHGHSFTGNPISCAAALANLKLLQESDPSQNWKRMENIHHRRLAAFSKNPMVRDTRLCGTIGVVELSDQTENYTSPISERMGAFALERGVFLRPLGHVIYVLPPYCTTDEQLHRVWDVIEEFLSIEK